ncbi:MAG: 4-hydroxy-tetrahydrodipicolinate reductase [Bacteroidetes bacterium]|nr:MAG: 4-hydroxy-tetrahydrodipicolinate reductase [Bacteroidota bacterium]
MKIGIIGHGKMGKAVESQALKRGHTIFLLPLPSPTASVEFADIDCAIDFSHAKVALGAVTECLLAGKHIVSGTTGWNDHLIFVQNLCKELDGSFCWAPNFSPGMHIMMHLNGVLADIMDRFKAYTPNLLEIHHTAKKDSPSGTAIAIADQIVGKIDRMKQWKLKSDEAKTEGTLTIDARREKDVKGIHRVNYRSAQDTISLRHHALSREGFALGAVLAAEWMENKTGYFTFEDVLDFKTMP